ncbi:hypothetical protein V8C42DRAFT_192837 [Trichoderma barbatum]
MGESCPNMERYWRANSAELRRGRVQHTYREALTGVSRVPEQTQLGELAAIPPRPCLTRLIRCLMAQTRNLLGPDFRVGWQLWSVRQLQRRPCFTCHTGRRKRKKKKKKKKKAIVPWSTLDSLYCRIALSGARGGLTEPNQTLPLPTCLSWLCPNFPISQFPQRRRGSARYKDHGGFHHFRLLVVVCGCLCPPCDSRSIASASTHHWLAPVLGWRLRHSAPPVRNCGAL